MKKKLHLLIPNTLYFIDSKQLGNGYGISAVVTAMHETSHILGGPAQLSTHEMKNASFSSLAD